MPAALHVRRRLVLWTIAILAVGALLFVAFRPSPVPVDLAEVQRGAAAGDARPRRQDARARPLRRLGAGRRPRAAHRAAAGRSGRRRARPSLAKFLPTAPALLDARARAEAEARVKAAEAVVTGAIAARDQAQATAKLADTQRDRAERLFAAGAASKSDLDAAVTTAAERAEDVQHARAAVASAQHDLDAARAVLLERRARARRAARPSSSARPSTASCCSACTRARRSSPPASRWSRSPIRRTSRSSSDYLSTDAVQMRPGMAVVIDRWGGGTPLHGRVRLVEPHGFLKVSALGVEEQRVNVVIAFDDPRSAWQALGDGYRVETHVVLWETADALKVPASALFRQGSGWAVFVAAGRARAAAQRADRQAERIRSPGARRPHRARAGAHASVRRGDGRRADCTAALRMGSGLVF